MENRKRARAIIDLRVWTPKGERFAPQPAIDRFFERLKKLKGGCWKLRGTLTANGYTLILVNGRATFGHRFSWEYFNGKKFPAGKDSDHLCRHRWCVNPDHIEPVTRSENTLRGARWNGNADRLARLRLLSRLQLKGGA